MIDLMKTGKEAFIIAEIGSNWTSLDDCTMSVRAAKLSGADAVKFQLFDSMALYGLSFEMKHALPREWISPIATEAKRAGIEFMCTAFSPELVRLVDPYVNIHKTASAEMGYIELVSTAAKRGKPVLVSTGSHHESDIDTVIRGLKNLNPSIIPTYCVAAYPAREIDLGILKIMKERYGAVGYSDHSVDVYTIPSLACETASVIEKHVTFIDDVTPDSPHSLNERQFKNMVKKIRGLHESRVGWVPEEQAMISRHNRRYIATKDLKPGDVLIDGDNMGVYRALEPMLYALSPLTSYHNREMRLAVPKKKFEGIGPLDLDDAVTA